MPIHRDFVTILAFLVLGAPAVRAADKLATTLSITDKSGVDEVPVTTSDDLIGAWELSIDTALEYPHQYIVVSKDHRIGWVAATTEINGATRSKLTSIISARKLKSGIVDGWHDWTSVPSKSSLKINVVAEGYYIFNIFTKASTVESIFGKLDLKVGDLLMAQDYPEMKTLNPPPVRLRRMRRLPD